VGAGNIQVPTGKVPEMGMEYVRKFRDVKYYETLFDLVSKQYEIARLDEASTVSSVQELDRARVPEKKSKPQRALIIILSCLIGTLLGVSSAFGHDAWVRMTSDPENAVKLEMIRLSLMRSHRHGGRSQA
jgi:tyrosine-protein kinase Etk/Wzc